MKKLKAFLLSIWRQLKDKKNLIIFACVLVVIYAPAWGVGLLGILFQNAGMIAFAVAYAAFWAGPFTPFFPLVIVVTFAIRKFFDKIHKK